MANIFLESDSMTLDSYTESLNVYGASSDGDSIAFLKNFTSDNTVFIDSHVENVYFDVNKTDVEVTTSGNVISVVKTVNSSTVTTEIVVNSSVNIIFNDDTVSVDITELAGSTNTDVSDESGTTDPADTETDSTESSTETPPVSTVPETNSSTGTTDEDEEDYSSYVSYGNRDKNALTVFWNFSGTMKYFGIKELLKYKIGRIYIGDDLIFSEAYYYDTEGTNSINLIVDTDNKLYSGPIKLKGVTLYDQDNKGYVIYPNPGADVHIAQGESISGTNPPTTTFTDKIYFDPYEPYKEDGESVDFRMYLNPFELIPESFPYDKLKAVNLIELSINDSLANGNELITVPEHAINSVIKGSQEISSLSNNEATVKSTVSFTFTHNNVDYLSKKESIIGETIQLSLST